MPPRRPIDFDIDELVQLYVIQNHSINMLSNRYGHCGEVLRRILRERDIEPRRQSAAGKMRHKREGRAVQSERQARAQVTRRANGATIGVAGIKMTTSDLTHRATIREQLKFGVGEGEETLASWLTERGLDIRRQVAVDCYNLDLAVDRLAIEVSRARHHPSTRPILRERTKNLVDLGWHVLYVWVVPEGSRAIVQRGWNVYSRGLHRSVTNEIVTHFQAMSADPAGVSKYRVIRGNGQEATRISRKGGEPSGRASSFHNLKWLYGRDFSA
jgi:very-short-patch-repair endonuclease